MQRAPLMQTRHHHHRAVAPFACVAGGAIDAHSGVACFHAANRWMGVEAVADGCRCREARNQHLTLQQQCADAERCALCCLRGMRAAASELREGVTDGLTDCGDDTFDSIRHDVVLPKVEMCCADVAEKLVCKAASLNVILLNRP